MFPWKITEIAKKTKNDIILNTYKQHHLQTNMRVPMDRRKKINGAGDEERKRVEQKKK